MEENTTSGIEAEVKETTLEQSRDSNTCSCPIILTTDDNYLYFIHDNAGRVVFGISKDGDVVVDRLVAGGIHNLRIADLEQRLQYAESKIAELTQRNNLLSRVMFDYMEWTVNGIMRNHVTDYTVLDSNIKSQASIDTCPGESTARFCSYTCDGPSGSNVKYQFVGYYDIRHQLTVAMRKSESTVNGVDLWGDFSYVKLDTFVEYDGHCYIHMAVDNDGCLHVAANMHAQPLNYWRFTQPYNIDHYVRTSMVGTDENLVTYPHFLKVGGSNPQLLFAYRNGYSGDGDHFINRYAHGQWTRVTKLFDGRFSQVHASAYCCGFIGDFKSPIYNSKTGFYELFFLWRKGSGLANGSTICYVRTQDFEHFYTYAGNSVTLPIASSTLAVRIDSTDVNNGLLNSAWKAFHSTVNNKGTLFCYHRYKTNGSTETSAIYAVIIKGNNKYGPTSIIEFSQKYDLQTVLTLNLKIEDYRTGNNSNTDSLYFAVSASIGGTTIKKKVFVSVDSIDAVSLPDSYNFSSPYPACLNTKENSDANIMVVKDLNAPEHYLLRYEEGQKIDDTKPIGMGTAPSDLKIIQYAARTE